MSLIWFLIIGLIAGWLAGVIMNSGYGVPGEIVIGILAEPSQFDRSEAGKSFVFNKGTPKVSTTF
jgi:hypothetical protein